jgi:hypothetical protein
MSPESFKRKLTAILSADVKGYSRLMGENEAETVKNIPDPVRAYKVLMEPEAAGKVIGEKEPKQTRWGWRSAAAVAVLVLVAGGLIWNFYWRAPRIEPASKEKMAFPLPDKPSIAVLPFVNMSDDPQQVYFSDGMTEDLITDLSKIAGLFVIARNSTFTYKGKPVKIRQVAEELGCDRCWKAACAGWEIRFGSTPSSSR